MSKSVMLLSRSVRKMRPQLNRMQKTLDDTGLALEGPFADRGGSLADLMDEIHDRMRSMPKPDPVLATIVALSPQNQDYAISSNLEVPFVLGETPEGLDCGCAGSLADSRTHSTAGKEVRVLDLESLTLVGIALLRRMGVPTLFTYNHVDPKHPDILEAMAEHAKHGDMPVITPVPGMFIMCDDGAEVLSFANPEFHEFPAGNLVRGVEVLGDDALRSVLTIKAAYRQAESLMYDVARRGEMYRGEGMKRAMATGHQLHDGTSAWTTDEAEASVGEAEELFGNGGNGIRSVRGFIENMLVRSLTCPLEHALMAADMMLSANEKKIVMNMVMAASRSDEELLLRIIRAAPQSARTSRMVDYMELAEIMKRHTHPSERCAEIDRSSSN
ncbi:MAG: hypothetical protein AB1295_03545 [Candidatus Micrarchaeota archaeon]